MKPTHYFRYAPCFLYLSLCASLGRYFSEVNSHTYLLLKVLTYLTAILIGLLPPLQAFPIIFIWHLLFRFQQFYQKKKKKKVFFNTALHNNACKVEILGILVSEKHELKKSQGKTFLWMRDRGTHQRQALVSYRNQIWSRDILRKNL